MSFAKTQDEFLVKAEKSLVYLLNFDLWNLLLVNNSVQGIYALPYIGAESQNQNIQSLNEEDINKSKLK